MPSIESLDFDAAFASAFSPHAAAGLVPARVSDAQRDRWHVLSAAGPLLVEVSGRLRHGATDAAELPTVGDWVAVAARPAEGRGTVHAVLPRRTVLVRKAAGRTSSPQVLAANVDVVFLATALDADWNPRRLERYLAFAWESGAQPVVVLTKADLCPDPEAIRAQAEAAAPGAPILLVSSKDGRGLDAVERALPAGRTGVVVGSSGVGKSTLVNRLLGAEVQPTREVREHDQRGVHTTTTRTLFALPGGGLLVDTPGLRELALLDDGTGLAGAFSDVDALALRCRFRDCAHHTEPGCAVLGAVETGDLDGERLEAWRHLARESAYLARRDDKRLMSQERARWKAIGKAGTEAMKRKRGM